MNVGIFMFSYAGDERIARKSLDILAKVLESQPQSISYRVFIMDDYHHPWVESFPEKEGWRYFKTTFDRRGNLNGKECAESMLAAMLKVTLAFGLDHIVKIDSDTILLKPDFGFGLNYCGSAETPDKVYYGYGSCYSMGRLALLSAYAFLSANPIEKDSMKGEDCLIGNAVFNATMGKGFSLHKINEPNALGWFWDEKMPNPGCYAISCKPGHRKANFLWTEEAVLKRMDALANEIPTFERHDASVSDSPFPKKELN